MNGDAGMQVVHVLVQAPGIEGWLMWIFIALCSLTLMVGFFSFSVEVKLPSLPPASRPWWE